MSAYALKMQCKHTPNAKLEEIVCKVTKKKWNMQNKCTFCCHNMLKNNKKTLLRLNIRNA